MKKNTSVVIFFVLIIYFVYAYGGAFLEGILAFINGFVEKISSLY